MTNVFGALLRRQRKERELTLGRVAEELGISLTFLSEVERGEKPPLHDKYFVDLAPLLGLAVIELEAAATASRNQFRLDASIGPRHREFAAALERRWTTLTEERIRELERVLIHGREGEGNGGTRR